MFVLKIRTKIEFGANLIPLQENFIINGVRSYFKVVVLAPSFCGEGSFRVIRDLSECIFFRRRVNESFPTPT